jgi:hypothetical protein
MRTRLCLVIATTLLAVGCGGAPLKEDSLSLSRDQMLARLIETGDSHGFTKTPDFSESCATYSAGTERHQLVIGSGMLFALRDIELAARGFPFEGTSDDPAVSPINETFRVSLVEGCGRAPDALVREVATTEYMTRHGEYGPTEAT